MCWYFVHCFAVVTKSLADCNGTTVGIGLKIITTKLQMSLAWPAGAVTPPVPMVTSHHSTTGYLETLILFKILTSQYLKGWTVESSLKARLHWVMQIRRHWWCSTAPLHHFQPVQVWLKSHEVHPNCSGADGSGTASQNYNLLHSYLCSDSAQYENFSLCPSWIS